MDEEDDADGGAEPGVPFSVIAGEALIIVFVVGDDENAGHIFSFFIERGC